MNAPRWPQSDSIRELARFWDAHDLTEFDDELEEVAMPVFRRETTIEVQLPSIDAARLRTLAQEKGVDDAELVREWVLDRIHTT